MSDIDKRGARNNASDAQHIQNIHDSAIALGAVPADPKKKKNSDKNTTALDLSGDLVSIGKFDATPTAPIAVSHGLAMGFAIVSKKDGQDYFDVQGDHIPEDAMMAAAIDFMQNSRVAKDMHQGEAQGSVVFAVPITADIRKYLLENDMTGLFIGMMPSPDILAKFKSGEYTGFSIGGSRLVDEEVE
jgi:hypothetical protein